jgi:ABC-2 type transport system ATP-binding protein
MENLMAQAEKLRKEYPGVVALRGLDLAVPAGEIFGLIGPNGAGKTTLLNVLATALRPDYGRASIAGFDIEKEPREVRRRLGYMPDFFNLYDDMTAEDFITYFGLVFGVEQAALPDRVDALLKEVNLETKRRAKVAELSRGMRQRLVFAKTLVHDPDVLLLDEPLSGLDPLARMEMREILRGLREKGKTVIISSHILTELSDFCTMVGIMEKGEMKLCGRIADILERFRADRLITVELLHDGDQARELLQPLPDLILEPGTGAVIKFRCRERETIAAANAALVAAGLRVVSLNEEKGDIEDLYFKVALHEVS